MNRSKLKINNPERWLLFTILFIQFPFHSRVGDDWPNSQLTKFMQWRYGEMTPKMFLTMVWKAIEEWMNGQGRFFPIAGLQGQLTLYLFKSDLSLAIFYGIFICTTIYCWMKILDKLFPDKSAGTYFLLVSIFMVRFRGNFDPHIGFAQLVIWSYFWVCISILFAIKSLENPKKTFHSVIAGLLYFTALCQYELSLIAFPVIIIILFIFNKKNNKSNYRSFLMIVLPIFIATFGYLIFVFGYLRPRANPTGNYIAGFNFEKSSDIFLKTVFAVVPQLGLGIREIFLLPERASSLSLVVFLSIVFLFVITKYFSSTVNHRNSKRLNSHRALQISEELLPTKLMILLVFAMSVFIIGPSLILSIQPNWWGYFKFGQTYLGIFYAEMGLSSIFAIFLSAINLKKQGKKIEK